MAEITAALVKQLREKTGAGMMDCKKALVETNGDADAAAELLPTDSDLLVASRRGRIMAVANLSDHVAEAVLPDGDWTVVFSSRQGPLDQANGGPVPVPPETALLLLRG